MEINENRWAYMDYIVITGKIQNGNILFFGHIKYPTFNFILHFNVTDDDHR